MSVTDWCLAASTLLAPVAMATCSIAGDSSLAWVANPLSWPALHVFPALALLPLLAPVLIRPPAPA
jgi:hypothetical protein